MSLVAFVLVCSYILHYSTVLNSGLYLDHSYSPAMSSVTLTESLLNISTFSVQDALLAYSAGYFVSSDYGDDPDSEELLNTTSAMLFSSGCAVDNIVNCTAACQDPSIVFADAYTLQNCMVVAALSTSALNNITIDSTGLRIARDFAIDPRALSFPASASSINQSIHNCFEQYCTLNGLIFTGEDDLYCPRYSASNSFHSLDSPHLCYENFCNSVMVPLNADISGIGVSSAK